METAMPRQLCEIAAEIRKEWRKPYFGAVPYLGAMSTLGGINDRFGFDSARSVVRYFLANASYWKGDTAKRIKRELKDVLKGH
jgi:hypothetical protein